MDEKQRLYEIGRRLDGPLGQIYRLVYHPHLKGLEDATKQIMAALLRDPSPENISTARAAIDGLRVAGASFLGRGLEAAVYAMKQPEAEMTPPKEAMGLYDDPTFDRTCLIVIPDFEAINNELFAHFAQHPEDLQQLDWRKFEELLEAIFRNQGYRTYLGPGRGDGGIDLRLIQKDSVGELVTLVQAKRYSPQNPVQLEAVAALHAVVDDQQANRGLFVTTSRYLPVAMEFAAKRSQRLVLATSTDVARWCQEVVSYRTR